jgi:hypothetical protein
MHILIKKKNVKKKKKRNQMLIFMTFVNVKILTVEKKILL